MTHGQEETLAAYGKDIMPQFSGVGGVGPGEDVRRRWDAVAEAWEAERETLEATNAR